MVVVYLDNIGFIRAAYDHERDTILLERLDIQVILPGPAEHHTVNLTVLEHVLESGYIAVIAHDQENVVVLRLSRFAHSEHRELEIRQREILRVARDNPSDVVRL